MADKTFKERGPSRKKFKVEMTLDQALKLGIVFCACGHPPNNHFDHDHRPCAHCDCKHYVQQIRLPQ